MKSITSKEINKTFILNPILIIVFLILFSSWRINNSFSYSNDKTIPKTEQKADSLMNIGLSFYESEPLKFIEFMDSAATLYAVSNNKKQLALCYQNIAFVYQEKILDLKKSEEFAIKSINFWHEINDTLKEANILKYLGLIQGELGKFAEAKSNIKSAIVKFNSKNFLAGVAVSYYDLGLVYEQEEQFDSCIYYLNLNKSFFESKHDTSRIFNVNNRLFHNYVTTKKFEEAKDIYMSNFLFEKSSKVRWNQKLDFYQFSQVYFFNINNEEMSKIYLNKYEILRDSLSQKGIYFK